MWNKEKEEQQIIQEIVQNRINLRVAEKEIEYLKTFNQFLIRQLDKLTDSMVDLQEVKGDD